MRMRLASLLLSSVTVIGGIGAVGMTACVVSPAYEYDADVEPPPPQQEVIEDRPGYVYIHGTWARQNNQWAWRAGRYEPVRTGYAYRDGGWNRQGNRWHYNEGSWESRPAEEQNGNVIIRDHRRENAPPPPQAPVPPGTVVVPAR